MCDYCVKFTPKAHDLKGGYEIDNNYHGETFIDFFNHLVTHIEAENSYDSMRFVSFAFVPNEESKRNIEAIKDASKLLKRLIPMGPTLNENHSYVLDAFKCGKCRHTH